ncbi:hypothetical protein GGI20_004579 [Coemansia sp. BCRC 34301]|nr:hypothetical protein GGI20_004579 [Coemansia sp. BCRC 34301]
MFFEAKVAAGDDAYLNHINQIADYALLLWNRQPTRKFVPALFLYKHSLTSRADRLPEGAVYKILESRGISNIPKIFASGILIKNFDGYHLEFLLMEHCGIPIVDYFQNLHGDFSTSSDAGTQATPYIKQGTNTLAEALEAGIYHRDISAGNITVKDGKTCVIDWGYARPINPPADLDLRTEIAAKWCFSWNAVLQTGISND